MWYPSVSVRSEFYYFMMDMNMDLPSSLLEVYSNFWNWVQFGSRSVFRRACLGLEIVPPSLGIFIGDYYNNFSHLGDYVPSCLFAKILFSWVFFLLKIIIQSNLVMTRSLGPENLPLYVETLLCQGKGARKHTEMGPGR